MVRRISTFLRFCKFRLLVDVLRVVNQLWAGEARWAGAVEGEEAGRAKGSVAVGRGCCGAIGVLSQRAAAARCYPGYGRPRLALFTFLACLFCLRATCSFTTNLKTGGVLTTDLNFWEMHKVSLTRSRACVACLLRCTVYHVMVSVRVPPSEVG